MKKNLFLLIITFLVTLFLIESGFRISGLITDTDYRLYSLELKNSDRLPAGLFLYDSIFGYKLRPDFQVLATTSDFSVVYKINSKGLRDKEYDYNKSNKIRILALGDSFTFGEGITYGKRFTDLAEKVNIEIINAGVPGYGLDQELIYLNKEGLKYNPEYIFLFINEVDTWRTLINLSEKKVKDTFYFEQNDEFFDKDSTLWASYFLSYLKYHVDLLILKNQLRHFDNNLWDKIKKNKTSEEKTHEEIVSRTKYILEEFVNVSNEHNITLIVVKIDISEKLEYLNEGNYIFLDLTDELKEMASKERLSFKYDPHYNGKTNKFIGERLKEFINEIT